MYVSWLSSQAGREYRLPSESEWEYAARAGTETQYSWGNEISKQLAQYNLGLFHQSEAQPVGSFSANSWGLHEMQGNAGEWVEDCWNDSYTGAPRDGEAWLQGDCSKRVRRGGYWDSSSRGVRVANRERASSGIDSYGFGFRVARTLSVQP